MAGSADFETGLQRWQAIDVVFAEGDVGHLLEDCLLELSTPSSPVRGFAQGQGEEHRVQAAGARSSLDTCTTDPSGASGLRPLEVMRRRSGSASACRAGIQRSAAGTRQPTQGTPASPRITEACRRTDVDAMSGHRHADHWIDGHAD